MQMFLIRENILDENGINQLEKSVDEEVQEATDRALAAAKPDAAPAAILKNVYSPDLDPTSEAFQTQPATDGPAKTMADLITACLRDEMKRDERVVIFGEDVADCSREEYLKNKLVKGKGGVFKLTSGLQMAFGADRVFNSPLAEATIVGRAIGIATRGLKPVPEVQFFDYIWPAMHQMRNELCNIRWRSNGAFSCPTVIRVAIGGFFTRGAVYPPPCGENIFTHTPPLRVGFPSEAPCAHGFVVAPTGLREPVPF